MFKYVFECSDEGFTRCTFKRLMQNDAPCGKTLFGGDLFGRGIHFTECEDRIKGFYLGLSENETVKGGSLARVSFNGRFLVRDDKTLFEVYIYPRIIEVFILFALFALLFAVAKPAGFLFIAFALIIFILGYYRDIKNTASEFQDMLR